MTEAVHSNPFNYVTAGALGLVRGLAGLPLEHPLEVIKVRLQANPSEGARSVALQILTFEGWKGFYAGIHLNAVRTFKQLYRWPMVLALPPIFQNVLPTSFQKKHSSAVPVLTGMGIASLETFIICPLERLKVDLITNDSSNRSIRNFYQSHKGRIVQELTRGLSPVFWRQLTSWVCFLATDEQIKSMERKRTGQSQLSLTSLLWVSALVGSINTGVVMPFDGIKTRLQMHSHQPVDGFIKTLTKTYQSYGLRGVYAGWQMRLTQYVVQSMFIEGLHIYLNKTK